MGIEEVKKAINEALIRLSVLHRIELADVRVRISHKSGIYCEIMNNVAVVGNTSFKELLNVSSLTAVLINVKIEAAFKKISGNDYSTTDFRLFTKSGCDPKCYMFSMQKPLKEIEINELI